jgi:HPt (histidine-containing phosphotransfer) domain-containing protein
MDDVLHKPYTLAKLATSMSVHLRAGSARIEVAEPDKANAPTVATKLLDPAALDGLLEMSGGEAGVVARVARLYCDHVPMRLADLRDAIAGEDFKRVASAAHALKSMSLNIGARAVAERAAKLELLAHNDKDNLTESMIEELTSVAAETCAVLAQKAA